MKKHLLKLMGILAISASAYAIAPDQLGPPITQGQNPTGSTTEVRVTANVVAGIAVNEASPIDFGNLVRGDNVYTPGEQIKDRTPGVIVFRGDKDMVKGDKIYAYLDTNMIELDFQNANGSNPNDPGTNTKLRRVRITGLGKDSTPNAPGGGEEITLVNGQAKKTLHAWFAAYDKGNLADSSDNTSNKADGNLGSKQKLGSYLGVVRVSADIK